MPKSEGKNLLVHLYEACLIKFLKMMRFVLGNQKNILEFSVPIESLDIFSILDVVGVRGALNRTDTEWNLFTIPTYGHKAIYSLQIHTIMCIPHFSQNKSGLRKKLQHFRANLNREVLVVRV